MEDIDPGKIAINPAWLKEMGRKRPGDRPIEELLAMLDGDGEKKSSTGEKQRRPNGGTRKR